MPMTNEDTNRAQLTISEGLWSQTALDPARAELVKKSYLLLALSVASAILGGYLGAQSTLLAGLFSGWLGWIIAMVVLNAIPHIALALRHDRVLGVIALAADGFASGLILSPILYFASSVAPDLIPSALILTAVVFGAVTAYVMTTQRTFSAPWGLMTGIFFSVVGLIVLNSFLQLGVLGFLIAGAIGLFGVLNLIYTTSDVLRNPEADSPVAGALMLFAGLFNVFVAVLDILLRLNSSDE